MVGHDEKLGGVWESFVQRIPARLRMPMRADDRQTAYFGI